MALQAASDDNAMYAKHLNERLQEGAEQFVHRIMKNARMLNTFETLQNVPLNKVYSAFDAWASQQKRLSQRTLRSLRSALDVRTVAEFKQGLASCVGWVARKLRYMSEHRLNGRNATLNGNKNWRFVPPYAMIVEVDPKVAKSSAWLAGPVVRELAKTYKIPPPAVIVPFLRGSTLSFSHVKRAIDEGIRTFVHVDDAVYSGLQKSLMVANLESSLRILQNMGYAEPAVALLIAVPYSTFPGRKYILSASNRMYRGGSAESLVNTSVYAAHALHPPRLPWLAKLELGKGRKLPWPTMTLLPFKVPNRASFGPASLGNALTTALPRPVYKSTAVKFLGRAEPVGRRRKGFLFWQGDIF